MYVAQQLTASILPAVAEDGRDIPEGPAGVRGPVLLLPRAQGTLQATRQALQEDPCRNLPQNTG